MNKQQQQNAMLKLATVRLAINHVLRSRAMQKEAEGSLYDVSPQQRSRDLLNRLGYLNPVPVPETPKAIAGPNGKPRGLDYTDREVLNKLYNNVRPGLNDMYIPAMPKAVTAPTTPSKPIDYTNPESLKRLLGNVRPGLNDMYDSQRQYINRK